MNRYFTIFQKLETLASKKATTAFGVTFGTFAAGKWHRNRRPFDA
jgi:hypothetical protein